MQQHKCVEDYLLSAIPHNIPDSKRSELRAEMESHIYDKAEFYMEIGYDEETAFIKAVDEMGETDDVKTEFESLYKDSAVKGVLWFVGICAMNLMAVASGLGYFILEHNYSSCLPSVFQLVFFLGFCVVLITHTVKCCRHKLHKQLKGITYAFAFLSLISFITSGMFFSVLYAVPLVFAYLTNGVAPDDYTLVFVINIIMLLAYTLLCFLSVSSDYRYRTKPYRLSVKAIAVILSAVSICFVALYAFAYVKYEYPYLDKAYYEELEKDNERLSDITKELFKVYNSVKIGDDVSQTQKMLKEKGFSEKNSVYEYDIISDELHGFLDEIFPPDEREEGIEKYITTSNVFSYDIEGELMQRISKNVGENKYFAYYYTIPYGEEESWDDIVSCIFISYDSEDKVDYKLFLPNIEDDISYSYHYSTHHGEDAPKWFENLKKGDSIESALRFIKGTRADIIEDEKKSDKGTVNTYKIYLNCFYNLEPSFFDFLVGYPPDIVSYSYEFDIVAENGKIISGSMLSYDNESEKIIKEID